MECEKYKQVRYWCASWTKIGNVSGFYNAVPQWVPEDRISFSWNLNKIDCTRLVVSEIKSWVSQRLPHIKHFIEKTILFWECPFIYWSSKNYIHIFYKNMLKSFPRTEFLHYVHAYKICSFNSRHRKRKSSTAYRRNWFVTIFNITNANTYGMFY